MNTVTIIGPTRRASYDAYLRRASVGLNTQPSTLVNYSYDEASRLKDVVNGIHSATYAYLENSPLIGQIEFKQSGTKLMTTSKQYDKVNRLTSIASSNSQGNSLASFAYDYNEANQRTQTRLMNGSYWVYNYDALGQVVSGKKYWADGSPVAGQQFEYAFDEIGNRTGTKAGGDQNGANLRSASYSPNLLNQYSSRTVPRAFDVTGVGFATNPVTVNGLTTYRKGEYFQKELGLGSSAAWWTNIQVQAGGSTTSGYVFTPATPEMFQYDLDGNLTNDGRWSYWWDGENRLTNMVANTTKGPQLNIRFEYDWQGRRIAKKVWNNIAASGSPVLDEKYVYDGWNLIAILNPDLSPRTSFVWGTDLSGSMQGAGGVGGLLAVYDRANGVHFTAFDGNGNVAALVSAATGEPSAQYEYGPFGEVIRATGPACGNNPFRFSTKYQDDETDLLYYGYRYLSSTLGRWLSRDPLWELGFEIMRGRSRIPRVGSVVLASERGQPNLLGLVRNAPINDFDPVGLCGGGGDGGSDCKCGENVTTLVYLTLQDIADKYAAAPFYKKEWAQFNMFGIFGADSWDIGWLKGGGFVSLNWAAPGCECNNTVTFEGKCVSLDELNYIMYGWGTQVCNFPRGIALFNLWVGLRMRSGIWDEPITVSIRKVGFAEYGSDFSKGGSLFPYLEWPHDCSPVMTPPSQSINIQNWRWVGLQDYWNE